jgi:heat-inducible transcriptional repressor
MNSYGIQKLNERSKAVFQHIIDSFLTTGEPIGPKTLSHLMDTSLSAFTIEA